MTELEKYQGIYGSPDHKGYGRTNHGKDSLAIWDTWRVSSIVDVGCGHNNFLAGIRKWPRRWKQLVGVDFACQSADICAPATGLPFFAKQFDLVTSFDCLEHLRPEEVDAALAEMARVSKAFVVSISYVPSVNLWQGEHLHPTVRPESWWIERLTAAGAVDVRKHGRYLYGAWAGGDDVTVKGMPMKAGASIVVVGNGPSVLQGKLGAQIDAFDEVVRFNQFKVLGYEEHTGCKTTLWATFGHGLTPQDGVKPQRVLIRGVSRPAYEPREIWRIPMALFYRQQERLKQLSDRQTDREAIIPSSGFLALAWLIEGGVLEVALTGFDHFAKEQSGQHHYWLKQSFGRPKEHDGDAEARIVAQWVSEGRVKYLAPGP